MKDSTSALFSLGLGNPRGNENPFLLTFGVFWYRWHNHVADRIARLLWQAYSNSNIKDKYKISTSYNNETFLEHFDEKIFNEARKWVIATHQVRDHSYM